MRVLTVTLCLAAATLAGIAINHGYLAGQSVADSPERAFDLQGSALTYGAAAVICTAVALTIHVLTSRRGPAPNTPAAARQ